LRRIPPDLRRYATASLATIVAAGLAVTVSGAPMAWLFLAICAVLCVAVLAHAVVERRFFDPVAIVGVVALASFAVRPLQLFLNSTDLLSWTPSESSLDMLLGLDNQEIAQFATVKLQEALQPALTRAIAGCALFLVCFLAGYALPLGRRLAAGVRHAGRSSEGVDVRVLVGFALVVGLAGQIAILARAGGVVEAADSQIQQRALEAGLALHVCAGFAVAGLLAWVAFARPRTRRAGVALAAGVLEVCAFYALIGSRSRTSAVLFALIIVVHFRWRPLRRREVLAAVVAGILLATAALGVRQATNDRPFVEALGSAPTYILDPRGILNDTTAFDQLFVATSTIGGPLPHRHGGWAVDAVRSYVPAVLDPGKPGPGDVEFREAVWGDTVEAGRPLTLIGDLHYDFSYVGIALGSLLLGVLGRGLLGLVASPHSPGGAFRVGLYALSAILLYQLLVGTYSIVLGSVITLVIPYLLVVHALGRLVSGGLRWRPAPTTSRSG
jgi:hypothetical protein